MISLGVAFQSPAGPRMLALAFYALALLEEFQKD
jgi:hypothetical protein